ncbi:hypothetical protein IPJ91_01715 [bacterium]|nr:MAG: hypothetical protein IPJ91_01715 [bacterium]
MKSKFNSQRLLEAIPGIITWIVLTSPLWAGILLPKAYGVFIILIVSYWVMKGIRFLVLFFYSYYRINQAKRIDWLKKLDEIKLEDGILDYKKLKFIVLLPFASEPKNVIESVIVSLKNQNIDTKQILILLATEARFPQGFEVANDLKREYEKYFGGFFINVHTLVEGEIAGKGSNANAAAKYMQGIIDENYDIEYTTILYTDSDSIYIPFAFSYFAYLFVQDKNRYSKFWSGAMNYMQNFWDLPFFSRILNSAFSFYNIPNIVLSETRFIQISSFFFSWKLFEEIGYSDCDIISDDYHIFYKALFKHFEKTKTEAMYMIIGSDACEGVGIQDTFKKQFRQIERWSWGIEDFPYCVRNTVATLKNRNISIKSKLYILLRVIPPFWNHQMWPISGIFIGISILAISIFTVTNSTSTFWLNLSNFVTISFSFATLTIIINLIASLLLRPNMPMRYTNLKGAKKYYEYGKLFILELLNWYLLPYYIFLLSGLPSLFSHTRLMLGKYIGFRLTEKK